MTSSELLASAASDSRPPAGLGAAAEALWYIKKGDWDKAHDIAQEDHSLLGSWVHALLHMIEGDYGNANYWFHKAHKPTRRAGEEGVLWGEIAAEALGE